MNKFLGKSTCFNPETIREIVEGKSLTSIANLERALCSLEYVGQLWDSGVDLVFKGGSTVQILLGDSWNRLSVDVDVCTGIAVEEIERYMRGIEEKFDVSVLRGIVDEFDLGFIVESIEALPFMLESRRLYRDVDESYVKRLVAQILDELRAARWLTRLQPSLRSSSGGSWSVPLSPTGGARRLL